MNRDKLLTTAQVARILNCSIGTVLLYIREGRFSQFYFIGKGFLVSEKAVDEFLNDHNPDNPKARID